MAAVKEVGSSGPGSTNGAGVENSSDPMDVVCVEDGPMEVDVLQDESSRSMRSDTLTNMRDRFYYTDFIEKARYADRVTEKKHKTIDENSAEDLGLDSNTSVTDDSASSSAMGEMEPCVVPVVTFSYATRPPSIKNLDDPPQTPRRQHSQNLSQFLAEEITSVTFADTHRRKLLRVRKIDSHREYTAKEKANCWFSREEKQKMIEKAERMANKLESYQLQLETDTQTNGGVSSTFTPKKSVGSTTSNSRGLESWTKAGGLKLAEVISNCVFAVLDEQDCDIAGYSHPDRIAARIAKASSAASKPSAERARAMALNDQAEATRLRSQPWTSKVSPDTSRSSEKRGTETLAPASPSSLASASGSPVGSAKKKNKVKAVSPRTSAKKKVASTVVEQPLVAPQRTNSDTPPTTEGLTNDAQQQQQQQQASPPPPPRRQASASSICTDTPATPPPGADDEGRSRRKKSSPSQPRQLKKQPSSPNVVICQSPMSATDSSTDDSQQKGSSLRVNLLGANDEIDRDSTRTLNRTISSSSSGAGAADPPGRRAPTKALKTSLRSISSPSKKSKGRKAKGTPSPAVVTVEDGPDATIALATVTEVEPKVAPAKVKGVAATDSAIVVATVPEVELKAAPAKVKRVSAMDTVIAVATVPEVELKVAPAIVKGVSFGNVSIRLYVRDLSDNPSVQSGPAVGIGWDYFTPSPYQQPFRLDDYEAHRVGFGPRTKTRSAELLLTRHEREMILVDAGFGQREIAEMVRSIIKAKNQRKQTVNNMEAGYDDVEAVVESARHSVGKFFRLASAGRRKP